MQRLIDADKIRWEKDCFYESDGCCTTYTYVKKYIIDSMSPVLTIPDNPTNGDMIKALFPNARYLDCDSCITVTFTVHQENWFSKDWWNAPYTKE